jgi:hypothetical protein
MKRSESSETNVGLPRGRYKGRPKLKFFSGVQRAIPPVANDKHLIPYFSIAGESSLNGKELPRIPEPAKDQLFPEVIFWFEKTLTQEEHRLVSLCEY